MERLQKDYALQNATKLEYAALVKQLEAEQARLQAQVAELQKQVPEAAVMRI